MSQGLQVSQLINVQVNLAPLAAQYANLSSLIIIGDSDVIDVSQRFRSYTSLAGVATDFGTSAPEYLAAQAFFGQSPTPTQVYIGRWAQSATLGRLNCGVLSAAQQLLSNFTTVTTGSFSATIDGTLETITGLDFHLATNLNGVASVINTAISAYGTCYWNGSQFVFEGKTAGTSGGFSVLTAAGSGTDVHNLLAGTTVLGAISVAGIVAESALAAVTLFDDLSTSFYGIMFASTHIVDNDHLAVAGYVQAATNPHIYGLSTTEATALNAQSTSDIGSLCVAAGYTRTLGQWSSSNAYAVASLFGRILTTDYTQNNSVITLMYKQEPGITAENLTATQAATLIAKRYNFFVNYANGTAILQNGVMFGPAFVDEITGTDWLANALQTNVYNLLYTSGTKIPQTDAGTHQIVAVIEATCAAGVNNGLLAPGYWTRGGFGTLNSGDFLPKGYYVYAPPVASQSSADRQARKSVPIQVAAKLAGAVHTVNVLVNVNR